MRSGTDPSPDHVRALGRLLARALVRDLLAQQASVNQPPTQDVKANQGLEHVKSG
jgi:hypothetical protein